MANIGKHGRRQRVAGGIVMLLLAGALAVWFRHARVARPWHLVLFVPLTLSALGFLQARHRTCVRLAALGIRNLDSGNERVTDQAELQRARTESRRIVWQSLLIAALVTVLLA